MCQRSSNLIVRINRTARSAWGESQQIVSREIYAAILLFSMMLTLISTLSSEGYARAFILFALLGHLLLALMLLLFVLLGITWKIRYLAIASALLAPIVILAAISFASVIGFSRFF